LSGGHFFLQTKSIVSLCEKVRIDQGKDAFWSFFLAPSLQNRNADDTLLRHFLRPSGNNFNAQFNRRNVENVFTLTYSKRMIVITHTNNTHKHSSENVDSPPFRMILLQSWKMFTEHFS
jgi:hypothetical protein